MSTLNRSARLGRLLAILTGIALILGTLSPRVVLAAAQPVIWPYSYEQIALGETRGIGIGFDNYSPTDPGYGPYIDVFLPAAGADGAGPATDDGLSFVSAGIINVGSISPLAPTPMICTGGSFTHPLTGLTTPCTDGDQILVFELPFGSIAPDQPPLFLFVYALMSDWADPGTPIYMHLNSGFWLGNDPLNNPASDPPIVQQYGPYQITPLPPVRLNKWSISPDNETATGISFPRQFSLSVDIAAGQTVSNLSLTDPLPPTLVYNNVVSINPPSCSVVTAPPTSGPQLPPNNELVIGCPSITGGGGSADVSLTFSYWVPRLDANGVPVLDPATGAARALQNSATVSGNWQPLDPRDSLFPISVSSPTASVLAQSIAVQHGWGSIVNDPQGNGLSPGDTIEYSLPFQISDHFAFDTIIFSERLSDGQHYLPGSARFSVTDRGGTLSGAFTDGVNLSIDTSQIGHTGTGNPPDGTDGSTLLSFNLSQAMRDLGAADGVVQGAETILPRSATAQGTVTFRVVIQEDYTDVYLSGDSSVDMWDWVDSRVSISGRVLDNQTLNPTGSFAADMYEEGDNQTSFYMPGPNLAKTVYAINGVACDPQPCANPIIEPGDTVTYRLTSHMPFVDVENPEFRDYLPLPIFSASEVLTTSAILASGLPPPGRVAYGPDDSFHSLPGAPAPALGVNLPNNMVSFIYPDYDLDTSPAGVIDLLFTVTASDRPFDNRLFITNQARASERSTQWNMNSRESNVEIGLAPLVLRLSKGVVAARSVGGRFVPAVAGPVAFSPPGSSVCPRFTGAISSNSLAAHPISSDLRNLLPGEQLTFAIVIENYGSSPGGAFDVTLRDVLPAGMLPTTTPICVTDGTGAPLAFSELSGGLFGSGIQLSDPGSTITPAGALDPYSPEDGHNIAVITYDVSVESSVVPPRLLTNSATLFNYAAVEGGPDDGRDKISAADVTVVDPTPISLLRFSATRTGSQIQIGWATGIELNTSGFILLRSDDGTRASALAVSPTILAQGTNKGGAEYTWVDQAAPPGPNYTYWLIEVTNTGATSEYGPAQIDANIQGGFRLFLPMMVTQ
jgi:large repetitive protein